MDIDAIVPISQVTMVGADERPSSAGCCKHQRDQGDAGIGGEEDEESAFRHAVLPVTMPVRAEASEHLDDAEEC